MKAYLKRKFSILNQLGIKVTSAEREHAKTLTNEIAIDQWARKLIKRGM